MKSKKEAIGYRQLKNISKYSNKGKPDIDLDEHSGESEEEQEDEENMEIEDFIQQGLGVQLGEEHYFNSFRRRFMSEDEKPKEIIEMTTVRLNKKRKSHQLGNTQENKI